MNIVFAGTPEFAKNILSALLAIPYVSIQAVFTQPDRPKGRGQHLMACPTKALALSHHIPIYQYTSLKTPENQAAVLALPWDKIDLLVTAAYGLILPRYLLTLPKYGCWNVHASLLPRWRGASPIQQAILAGDAQTGITLMQMGEGLDDGDILWQEACTITPHDTYSSLEQKLACLGTDLLTRALNKFNQDPHAIFPLKQDDLSVTHAPKIAKEEAHLDWALPAETLERKIRAFSPAPGCFAFYENQRLKIWKAEVLSQKSTHAPGTLIDLSSEGLSIQAGNQSILRLTHGQLPGKNKAPFSEILNGHPNFFTLNSRLT
jgi:methionyl-tRNA formyltransferase